MEIEVWGINVDYKYVDEGEGKGHWEYDGGYGWANVDEMGWPYDSEMRQISSGLIGKNQEDGLSFIVTSAQGEYFENGVFISTNDGKTVDVANTDNVVVGTPAPVAGPDQLFPVSPDIDIVAESPQPPQTLQTDRGVFTRRADGTYRAESGIEATLNPETGKLTITYVPIVLVDSGHVDEVLDAEDITPAATAAADADKEGGVKPGERAPLPAVETSVQQSLIDIGLSVGNQNAQGQQTPDQVLGPTTAESLRQVLIYHNTEVIRDHRNDLTIDGVDLNDKAAFAAWFNANAENKKTFAEFIAQHKGALTSTMGAIKTDNKVFKDGQIVAAEPEQPQQPIQPQEKKERNF
ncbi:MAG: hypothetical protein QF535_21605, partial [Anaerolineales bacterium]|nr:hypothetical protein [Anaerolineales bacterium]